MIFMPIKLLYLFSSIFFPYTYGFIPYFIILIFYLNNILIFDSLHDPETIYLLHGLNETEFT
jgi:hypothetical protein